jgi:glycosyltransferase involved in cell wall biosynthesis
LKTALLVSTYNWPEALQLVLDSIKSQTILPHEILIADDGSTEETKVLIELFSNSVNIPVIHSWQEDKGFRKSKILNKTIAKSNADYIIQIDGDCILHKNFVEDHIKNALTNTYLYGSRVNILPTYVIEVLKNKIINFTFFSKEIKNKTRSIYLPFLSSFFKIHPKISKKFRGCNVSFWRKDFTAINGYNEEFEGWGREDSDLVIRMMNLGIQAKRLRYCGILFHIHHKINSKQNIETNNLIEHNTIKNKLIRCKNGVDQYLNND